MSAVTNIDGFAFNIDDLRRVFVGKMETEDNDTYVIDFTNKNYADSETRLYVSGEALSSLGYLIELTKRKHKLV